MDNQFDRAPYAILKRVAEGLAGVCDGAQLRDDQGFDGGDTITGHLLAFLPLDAWPLSGFHRAWRWTKKYHRQLAAMQIPSPMLPEPPPFKGEDRQIALMPDGGGAFVVFPYESDVIAAFQQLPGGKTYRKPIGTGDRLCFYYRLVRFVPGAREALCDFARSYGFQIGPGVIEGGAPPAVVPSRYRLMRAPDACLAYVLYFPHHEGMNTEIKAIPGRRPDLSGGFHWVIPATTAAAAALVTFLDRHASCHFQIASDLEQELRDLAAGARVQERR